ncbi:MAG: Gldg family protein, partial [Pirellulaceae bacterium]|nr:Gldg family protein [Pirellulaceae bacterium]
MPIFRRNFSSYFSGVLGYLFIVVFVTAGAAMAFNARFFTANEPSLDQLTEWYPLLLLFFVPAITMGVWADERKVGTDELLFTLPATDIEILLGKYLSVLAVYSVALLFSMTHVIVLSVLGNPDWGLLFTTYFGYWIAGAALISAGMLASILTSSMTVAFVIGIVICCIPVFLGYLGEFTGLRDFFESLSLREQFRDFGMGVIPFTGLLYFVSFTVFMLYLNMVMMTRRHWSARRSAAMGAQYSLRSVCLALILICVTSWAGYAAIRVDATSERLFSLSSSTRTILRGLESERPIEIQAFISPDVPREYVETRKRLVGLLRQFDELGGKNLEVRYVE